jgi:hypothetical protein
MNTFASPIFARNFSRTVASPVAYNEQSKIINKQTHMLAYYVSILTCD